jgi:hypothetical protein
MQQTFNVFSALKFVDNYFMVQSMEFGQATDLKDDSGNADRQMITGDSGLFEESGGTWSPSSEQGSFL